jgi:hypothetical protein
MQELSTNTNTPVTTDPIDGVIIGILIGIGDDGLPLVAFPGNPESVALRARSCAPIASEDIGREVALLFEGGDRTKPLVVGCIQRPDRAKAKTSATNVQVDVDNQRCVLSAEKEIVLRCGKASITLTRAGKIFIRGAYLLSRSSGVNRVKGGSVQIN